MEEKKTLLKGLYEQVNVVGSIPSLTYSHFRVSRAARLWVFHSCLVYATSCFPFSFVSDIVQYSGAEDNIWH